MSVCVRARVLVLVGAVVQGAQGGVPDRDQIPQGSKAGLHPVLTLHWAPESLGVRYEQFLGSPGLAGPGKAPGSLYLTSMRDPPARGPRSPAPHGSSRPAPTPANQDAGQPHCRASMLLVAFTPSIIL